MFMLFSIVDGGVNVLIKGELVIIKFSKSGLVNNDDNKLIN